MSSVCLVTQPWELPRDQFCFAPSNKTNNYQQETLPLFQLHITAKVSQNRKLKHHFTVNRQGDIYCTAQWSIFWRYFLATPDYQEKTIGLVTAPWSQSSLLLVSLSYCWPRKCLQMTPLSAHYRAHGGWPKLRWFYYILLPKTYWAKIVGQLRESTIIKCWPLKALKSRQIIFCCCQEFV